MEKILKYLCVLVLIVMISATTVNVMTVKPATPKVVLVENFKLSGSAKEFIKEGYKKGFQLKSIQTNSDDFYNWIVVMEKY